jgi:hypothetical protein
MRGSDTSLVCFRFEVLLLYQYKFHKTWGIYLRLFNKVQMLPTYMTKNLVSPPKVHQILVNNLKPYVSRLDRLRPPSLEDLTRRNEDVDDRQILEDLSWDHPEEVGWLGRDA